MKIKEFLMVYAIGSIGYRFIEILWRGETHWSMGIVGGICFLCMYCIDIVAKAPILQRALYSTLCVTIVEFISGLILNIGLGMDVWDYSTLKFNLLGQISLLYSVFWYFLCIPAHYLCRIVRHRIFGALPQKKRHFPKIFERQPNIR